MIIKINIDNPQKRLIEQVVEVLKDGGIIAYPTDTYFGIGCDIMNKKAIEKIYLMKKRDKNKPFTFLCSDLKDISKYAKVSNSAYKIMHKLVPGPYTFILEGSKFVPKIMLTKRKTAGIRVPNNNICIEIIKELGNPIISTTAKDLAGNNLENADLIADYFKKQIDIVIDMEKETPNAPSSVISFLEDEVEIIREGRGDLSLFK